MGRKKTSTFINFLKTIFRGLLHLLIFLAVGIFSFYWLQEYGLSEQKKMLLKEYGLDKKTLVMLLIFSMIIIVVVTGTLLTRKI